MPTQALLPMSSQDGDTREGYHAAACDATMAGMAFARASSAALRWAGRVALVVVFLALSSSGAAWGAPTRDECVASYDKGQKLRAAGSLRAAREEFLICAEASCPEVTKNDCSTWIGQVEESLPTLTFVVTDDAGNDVSEARVSIDGALLVERLDGKAVRVDPGPHELRFERSGAAPVTLDIVVQEGEKNRRVELKLGAGGSSSSAAISPAAWALGGAGLVGITIFAVLGGIGLSQRSDAEDTCGPSCSDDVVDSIRTKFIAADVALSVGLVALGAGIAIGIATGIGGGAGAGAGARTTTLHVGPPPFLDGVALSVQSTF